MDWKNLPSGGNVEDRRGAGGLPGGGVAVGGIGGLILALIAMFFGVDPGAVLGGGNGGVTVPQQSQTRNSPAAQDETYQFADRIMASTDSVWNNVFQQAGRTYTEPTLVLFQSGTRTACGSATSAVGPFYCPLDNKVYLDTSFFNVMQQRLGGGGTFAYSYVLAHEVGHHVQNELGIADQVERKQQAAAARGNKAEANSYSVRLELQADCFAGVWGSQISDAAKITQQDVQQAVNTAQAIGDDNLQRQSQGMVVPDSFTHGSSAQRVNWFMKGFKSGNPNSCDTFNIGYNQL